MSERVIVTFSCQKSVFVYPKNSIHRPMFPFRSHPSIKAAKEFLKETRGIKNAKVITDK